MDQVLHRCATTTEAVRQAIQHRKASLRSLAKHYGINQKTVAQMATALLGQQRPDWTESASLDSLVDRG